MAAAMHEGTGMERVRIVFMGQSYEVPALSTVLQALEGVGYQFVRGVGCRGGLCGACAYLGHLEGEEQIRPGLACQSIVADGLHISPMPSYPIIRSQHVLEDRAASYETVRNAYPEILRCIGCNTCTRVCPQDIPVMDLLSATFRNDFFRIADKSFDCILCGLCGARCPADIAPFNIFLYVRRLTARHLTAPSQDVAKRVAELDAGAFEADLDRLMSGGKDELEQAFRGYQAARTEN